jgi:hypothetical protein
MKVTKKYAHIADEKLKDFTTQSFIILVNDMYMSLSMMALLNIRAMIFSTKPGSTLSSLLAIATLFILTVIVPYLLVSMTKKWAKKPSDVYEGGKIEEESKSEESES